MTYPFEASRGVTPEIEAKFKSDCANRMRLLNKLKAAPGQPNRALVRDFLYSKGWIKQEPEEWALYALPKDDDEYAALLNIIAQFERQQQQQAQADLREELI